jgi:hypothetical protein
MGWKVGK